MEKFKKDNHTIYLGEAINVLSSEIENETIDLIFVDPPYNIGKIFNGNKDRWKSDEDYLEWSYKWIDLCLSKLKNNDKEAICFGIYFAYFVSK